MNIQLIKKIGFISVFFLVAPIGAANLFVTNRIADKTGLRIRVEGNPGDPLNRIGNFGWGSGNLPNGKLTKEQGFLHIFSCCQEAEKWKFINLYVTNKNNVDKKISIPLDFPQIDKWGEWLGDFYYYWYGNRSDRDLRYARRVDHFGTLKHNQVVIIFKKNAAGMVEVYRALVDDIQSNFHDEKLVTTLAPADYE